MNEFHEGHCQISLFLVNISPIMFTVSVTIDRIFVLFHFTLEY